MLSGDELFRAVDADTRRTLRLRLMQSCAVCNERLMNDDGDVLHEFPSFALFGECLHIVHLECMTPIVQRMAESTDTAAKRRLLHGGVGSLCTQCAKMTSAATTTTTTTTAAAMYTDKDFLLRELKAKFQTTTGGVTFDEIAHAPAPAAIVQEMRAPPPPSNRGVAAVGRLLGGVMNAVKASAAAAATGTRTGTGTRDGGGFSGNPDDFYSYVASTQRTYDDLCATPRGTLLYIYAAGIKKLYQLVALRFTPARHITRDTKNKARMWHLCALYGVQLADLLRPVAEGGFGMTVRSIARDVYMRPMDWAMLGATAQSLIALGVANGIDRETVRRMNMTPDHWRRYLALEPTHLIALGINTRADFVEYMGWPEADEYCPPPPS